MTRIWRILIWALKSLKNLPFDWCFTVMLDQKSREESSFMILESDAKFDEKLTCGLWNNMRNLANFHQSTSKSENWDFNGVFFVQSWKYMRLKLARELFFITMKNDTKTEEELTCEFKINMRNLTNFDPSTQKSQKFALPLTKVYNVWAKNVQGSYVWWHWILIQNLKEN